jgi:hypothetical protein
MHEKRLSMRNNTTIFRQILQCLPSVSGSGRRYIKHFTDENLLITLILAQIYGLDSLRDIETYALMHEKELKNSGIKSISRSNLAHALKVRDSDYFRTYYMKVAEFFNLHCGNRDFKYGKSLKIIDSSIISLCLKLFEWANYQHKKGALKMHMMLDYDNLIPDFTIITEGNTSDIDFVRDNHFSFSSDSIYVFDRGYFDYEWYYSLTKKNVTFVTRIKGSMSYESVNLLGQQDLDKDTLITDEEIRFSHERSRNRYPEKLRLVTVYDFKEGKTYEYLTNNFDFKAETVAEIYRSRWEIESFFRWIKQNLKIKSFLGTSKNAVIIQIYVALVCYVLLMYLKKMLNFTNSLGNLATRIKTCLLEKMSFEKILSKTIKLKDEPGNLDKTWEQLAFF